MGILYMSALTFNAQPAISDPQNFVIQRRSTGYQVPFFFGAAQTPNALKLNPDKIQGQGVGRNILIRRRPKDLEVIVKTHKVPIFK